MKPKAALADYFTFSKKDRLAIIIFLIVVGGLMALPLWLPQRPPALSALPDSVRRRPVPLQDAGESPEANRSAGAPRYSPSSTDRDAWRSAPLFPFDPNQLDAAGWKKLGLTDRAVGTLMKYRERGGRFRRPEDLAKIWSLPPGFVERVLPYVRIADGGSGSPGFARYPDRSSSNRNFPDRSYPNREPRSPTILSVNEADSTAWESLPGIGAKLAGRIVRYRERLGGFSSVDQVGEVWGLPDSSFRKIRTQLQLNSSGGDIRKLNLNIATKDELKNHPYIRWNLANVLVEYRQRHGAFRSLDDLKKVLILPDSVFKKLLPYVAIE
ncbi:MAG: hypothetical protein EOO51_15405 [Flavobacterium sp.]|nr:MAG: hypothetical protein EOO51_15405 [Flavobacterium sp.]